MTSGAGMPPDRPGGPKDETVARRFSLTFVLATLTFAALTYGVIAGFDPYGVRRGAGEPGPLMDINQRYVYPQIVRSGRYSSAVFGTSTVRLLDPQRLDKLLGGRFANLAMNAATPWEQMQIADLFLRHTPAPGTLVFGIDAPWCDRDADSEAKRLTPRPFPPWLYDDDRLNDWAHLFNSKNLEIALRVAAYRLGLMDERIRGDGYEVFVPPEDTYDLSRARMHIWQGHAPEAVTSVVPAETVSEAERKSWRFPALAWLDAMLARAPATARKMILLPPVHVAVQPRPGSKAVMHEEACKAMLAEIAQRHGALLLDFRRSSPVTREDSNYWDPMHYRIGIARRIEETLAAAMGGATEADDGFFVTPGSPVW
ncbi:hypothetical protein [Chelatococcus daeguensis]|uniref:hypothetical protein n=1 Tax=Chelatococcus daeguensis TaxID=444444 RepID=UPI001FD87679|nr:hypothetical protein [Chelatococcus daeguensis]